MADAYRCRGCGAAIEGPDDLAAVQGTVRRSWRCRECQTTVPSVVAERIQHRDR